MGTRFVEILPDNGAVHCSRGNEDLCRVGEDVRLPLNIHMNLAAEIPVFSHGNKVQGLIYVMRVSVHIPKGIGIPKYQTDVRVYGSSRRCPLIQKCPVVT